MGELAVPQILNPPKKGRGAGRPPGSRDKRVLEIVEACRKLAPKTMARMERIITGPDDMTAIMAAKVVLAYAYGKPKETIDINGEIKFRQEVGLAAQQGRGRLLNLVKRLSNGTDVLEPHPAAQALAAS